MLRGGGDRALLLRLFVKSAGPELRVFAADSPGIVLREGEGGEERRKERGTDLRGQEQTQKYTGEVRG